jgi:uncharacterized protein (TIRG00374 family)
VSKRRIVILTVVFAVLAVLVYLQIRTWKRFDFGVFLNETSEADPLHLLSAVALIYSTYYLRAMRWKIFLRPVRNTTAASLTAPQFIGFTGLALLGRPGEFIRPYLIARRESLPFPSQVAVWAVERIFDMGSVAILLAAALFSHRLHTVPYFRDNHEQIRQWYDVGFLLVGFVMAIALSALLIRRNGDFLANWSENRLRRFLPGTAHLLAEKIRHFGEGLNTIHSGGAFLQLLAISLLIWVIDGLAYFQVIRAYPNLQLHAIELPHVALLMVASMAGSVIQLPAVGGGSQLATIKVLEGIFKVRPEAAASCGIMLWLVTFMAVIPTGLFLAHREHVSLRELEAESHVKANSHS